jgi:subtilisin family serine protease
MSNQIDLKGRLAVVTGGAQGIGYAVAKRLTESGAKVALWDRDETRIPTGILDVGFAPSPDLRTPLVECDMEAVGPGGMLCGPGRAFGFQRVGNSLFGSRTWHGTGVATTLAGKLNNRWSPGDDRIGGRAGVAGQIAQPMLYQYGLGSYVFEFGAGMQKAASDGASVINVSGGYPCRIADNLGIGFNICSPGGRAALCTTATAILATASAAISPLSGFQMSST